MPIAMPTEPRITSHSMKSGGEIRKKSATNGM